MPSRNVVKEYATEQFYHVYNRGVAKQLIFHDAADKSHFLKIIDRHLDPDNTSKKSDGSSYYKFNKDIEIISFCLMGNHFHILLYTLGEGRSMSTFMQSIMTAYTMYFNKRYKRVGTLFQGVFKASRVSQEAYLLHITRYIHLNPRTYKTYRYSSLRYYVGEPAPVWLRPERVTCMFNDVSYLEFVESYKANHAELEEIKHELANY